MSGKKQGILKNELSVTGMNIPLCRICQSPSSTINHLISPCNCKGTLAHVHFSCLEKWLNTSSRISCELCNFQYDTLQTRRYTLWESLRLWIRHPVNWRHLQADLFIFTLLSIVTLGFVLICVLGLEYFVLEGKKYGVSKIWTKGALNFFMTIILVGYTGSMIFLVKEQLRPWYYWWTNTYNIKLRLSGKKTHSDPNRMRFEEITLNPFGSNESLRHEISVSEPGMFTAHMTKVNPPHTHIGLAFASCLHYSSEGETRKELVERMIQGHIRVISGK